MKREELIKIGKPILFNTEMVQAILDDRKTVTRRVVKPHRKATITNMWLDKKDGDVVVVYDDNFNIGEKGYIRLPYKVGDILYVRETWTVEGIEFENDKWVAYIGYKAEGDTHLGYQTKIEIEENEVEKYEGYLYGEAEFKPSLHMPKKASRIFLKVTDIRVEKLQDITEEQALKEGIESFAVPDAMLNPTKHKVYGNFYKDTAREAFAGLWDAIYLKKMSGWYDNPWVWVIEFERVEVEE